MDILGAQGILPGIKVYTGLQVMPPIVGGAALHGQGQQHCTSLLALAVKVCQQCTTEGQHGRHV